MSYLYEMGCGLSMYRCELKSLKWRITMLFGENAQVWNMRKEVE